MGLTGRQIYVIYFILKNAETRGKNYAYPALHRNLYVLYSTAWHDVFLYPGGWCFSNVFNYNNKIVFENRSSVSFTDLRAKKLYVCCDEEKRNLFR